MTRSDRRRRVEFSSPPSNDFTGSLATSGGLSIVNWDDFKPGLEVVTEVDGEGIDDDDFCVVFRESSLSSSIVLY